MVKRFNKDESKWRHAVLTGSRVKKLLKIKFFAERNFYDARISFFLLLSTNVLMRECEWVRSMNKSVSLIVYMYVSGHSSIETMKNKKK